MLPLVCPLWLVVLFAAVGTVDGRIFHDAPYSLTDALLREVVAKMGEANDYLELPNDNLIPDEDETVSRVTKELNRRLLPQTGPGDYDTQETMLRDQEYLQHSSLWGHQYVAGGAGEGKQRLKPDGSVTNVHEVKTDNVLPAYCNPPNPCPVGYSGEEDGCLDEFVNSAAFSREYQASQECMCDTEHMFDCPSSTRENEISALAQSIQSEGVMNHALDKIMEDFEIHGQHKNMVAKKWHQQAPANKPAAAAEEPVERNNPYLEGEKLPIVAKKTPRIM